MNSSQSPGCIDRKTSLSIILLRNVHSKSNTTRIISLVQDATYTLMMASWENLNGSKELNPEHVTRTGGIRKVSIAQGYVTVSGLRSPCSSSELAGPRPPIIHQLSRSLHLSSQNLTLMRGFFLCISQTCGQPKLHD